MGKVSLADVKRANSVYFAKGQKEFFGDISYRILTSSDGLKWLITETFGFSDMFGAENKRAFWTAKAVNMETLKIASGHKEFKTLDDVCAWLKKQAVAAQADARAGSRASASS